MAASASGADHPHFLLLYAAMLVAAAGNTALNRSCRRSAARSDSTISTSRLPTPGRQCSGCCSRLSGQRKRPSRPQDAGDHGSERFIVSMSLCGMALFSGLTAGSALASRSACLPHFGNYGGLGCAHPRRPGLSCLENQARRARRSLSALSSSFGLGTIIGRRSRRCSFFLLSGSRAHCSPSR